MNIKKYFNKLLNESIYKYILCYILIFGSLSCFGIWLQIRGLATIRPDNFLFDNEMWSMFHNQGLFSPILNHYNLPGLLITDQSDFGIHFSPVMFLVYCFYYFVPSIFTMFAVRTIALGLAAVPLYLIGKELVDEKTAKIIAITYLIYPTVMWNTLILYYSAYLPLFAFTMIYAYIKNKKILFYISFILCLSTKENVGIFLFPLAGYFAYDGYKTKIFSGRIKWDYLLPVLTLTPVVLIFAIKVFIPHFNSSGEYIHFNLLYTHYGTTPFEFIKNVLKQLFSLWTLIYILELFIPISFVPVFSSPILIAMVPTFLQNALVPYYQTMFYDHYSYEIIIVMFLAVIIYFRKSGTEKLILYFDLSIFWAIVFSLIKIFLVLKGGI
jgi:uncharacterized membrane protein